MAKNKTNKEIIKELTEQNELLKQHNSEKSELIVHMMVQIDQKQEEEKTGINDFNYKDMVEATNHGFWYAINSQHNGEIPLGYTLQWMMTRKSLVRVPDEWKQLLNKKTKEDNVETNM